jgi:arylsulfatase
MRSFRFWFMTILFLAFAASFLAQAQAAERKPNILLVMVDDMGWTDIGSFGGEIDTPNLDVLAAEGMKFTDFHASISCSPTRSMLLSGTDNHIAGLGNMGELLTPDQRGKPGYEGYLNDRVVSLAEVLREGGYHTYMAGKWHLGHKPERYPAARGFERSLSMLYGGASHFSDMWGLMEVETPAHYVLDGKRIESLPKDFFSSRSYADFLMDAIRSNRGDGKPFFGYLAFTAPHDPMHVPEPWLSKYRGRYDDGYKALQEKRVAAAKKLGLVSESATTPAMLPNVKPWKTLSAEERAVQSRGMEVYAGMIDNLDYHYGRVVKFLKDIDEYENTIVIFLSDNGANPWYSEEYPGNLDSKWFSQFDNSLNAIGHPSSNYSYGMGWASASSGPLDRFKMTVSEGGIRVPLLIAGPGIKAGQKTNAFTYVTDLMPTVLEMAGLKHPKVFRGRPIEPMSGRSLVSLLSGSPKPVYGPNDLIGGELLNGKWMRQGDYKAVSVAPPYGEAKWHLYNLASDPGETSNLAKRQPERLKKLQAAWDRYAKDVGVVMSK